MARIDALHRDPPPPLADVGSVDAASTRSSAGGLVAAIASTGLAVLAAALCFTDSGPLRWLAGIALILIMPGEVIRRLVRVPAATVPGAVITVSVSLALTVLVGVVVDQTGAGFSARTMAVGLLAVTTLANVAVVAAPLGHDTDGSGPGRGKIDTGNDADSGIGTASGPEPEPGVSWRVALLCLALFAIPAGIAVGVATHSAQHQSRSEASAALSIQRQGEDAVVEVDQDTVTDSTYILQVTTGSRSLLRMKFALREGARREFLVSRPAVALGQRLTATLSLPGQTQAIRSVWLVNTGP